MPALSMSAVGGKADTLTTHTTVFQVIAISFRNQLRGSLVVCACCGGERIGFEYSHI
jgi:hypothetical protein